MGDGNRWLFGETSSVRARVARNFCHKNTLTAVWRTVWFGCSLIRPWLHSIHPNSPDLNSSHLVITRRSRHFIPLRQQLIQSLRGRIIGHKYFQTGPNPSRVQMVGIIKTSHKSSVMLSCRSSVASLLHAGTAVNWGLIKINVTWLSSQLESFWDHGYRREVQDATAQGAVFKFEWNSNQGLKKKEKKKNVLTSFKKKKDLSFASFVDLIITDILGAIHLF